MQFNFTHQSRLPGKRQPFILAGKDERLIRFMARLASTQEQPSRPGLRFVPRRGAAGS